MLFDCLRGRRALAMIERKVKGRKSKPAGATPQRPGRRHLRGIKEKPRNRRSAGAAQEI